MQSSLATLLSIRAIPFIISYGETKMKAAGGSGPVLPVHISTLVWAPMRLRVLQAAIRTGLFDALAPGPKTAAQVARSQQLNARAVRMVLDELCALGLLTKRKETYSLTQESATFLVSNSAVAMVGMVEYADDLARSWNALPEVIRSGKPVTQVQETSVGEEFFRRLVSQIFPTSYASAAALLRHIPLPARQEIRILDVAAGSGAWSLPFAQKYRRARVTAADLPFVLEVTRDYAARYGVADRYDEIPGDIRKTNFGKGTFDLALLGHICHSEGPQWSKRLIAKVAKALKPGGMIVIPDMVPNEQRTAPEFPVLFAINMLLHTAQGDTFTLSQYSEWLKAAGLTNVKLLEAPVVGCDIVIAAKPAASRRR